MSQNVDNDVVSYQNSSSADHTPLNLDNRVDSNISDDDTDTSHRRGDRRASIEKMSTLIEHLHRRRKRCHPISFTSWCIVFVLLSWVVYKHSHHQTLDGEDINDDNDFIIDTNSIPNLIWNDEFNGNSVDLSKWTFVNGDGCEFNLCGWGNAELEWYNSNAKVSNGRLVIEARKEVVTGNNSTYTSAKIISRHKADFSTDNLQSTNTKLKRSRRFESRLMLPSGQGIWPAFWMLPTNNTYGGWPRSGEIDIMESIGKEGPDTVHGTVHYGLEWPQHQYAESGITHPANYDGSLNETFHTYSVERSPGVIRWYIDDIEYSSITKQDMVPYHWPFDEEFYFIYNLAVGGNWPGMPNEDTIFPQQLEIDYVRVYEDVFPRIVGQSVVEYSATQVVYEVVNLKEVKGISFTWTVPRYATIKRGQGTSHIVVDFDSKLMNNTSIIESDIIQVQANGIDEETLSTSIGLSKLANGIGYRIKIVDYNGLKDFDFDCGRLLTCTKFVLNKITDTEYTCGERIAYLMREMGMNERDACTEVSYKQFHGHCGPCNPLIEPP